MKRDASSWFRPFTPATHVEGLAQTILRHENLSPRELPRCRREVRLQMTYSPPSGATALLPTPAQPLTRLFQPPTPFPISM